MSVYCYQLSHFFALIPLIPLKPQGDRAAGSNTSVWNVRIEKDRAMRGRARGRKQCRTESC